MGARKVRKPLTVFSGLARGHADRLRAPEPSAEVEDLQGDRPGRDVRRGRDLRDHHLPVHLTVRALGDDGRRLNPKKGDLEFWRQGFAQALRDHGVAAEATPGPARGVTRKAERTPLRKSEIGQRRAAVSRAGCSGAPIRKPVARPSAAIIQLGNGKSTPAAAAAGMRSL